MSLHIHKYGEWETIRLKVETYLTGYFSKSEEIVQIKKCVVCGKAKKHKP